MSNNIKDAERTHYIIGFILSAPVFILPIINFINIDYFINAVKALIVNTVNNFGFGFLSLYMLILGIYFYALRQWARLAYGLIEIYIGVLAGFMYSSSLYLEV